MYVFLTAQFVSVAINGKKKKLFFFSLFSFIHLSHSEVRFYFVSQSFFLRLTVLLKRCASVRCIYVPPFSSSMKSVNLFFIFF